MGQGKPARVPGLVSAVPQKCSGSDDSGEPAAFAVVRNRILGFVSSVYGADIGDDVPRANFGKETGGV